MSKEKFMNLEVSIALVLTMVAFVAVAAMPILLPFIALGYLAALAALGFFNNLNHLH